MSRGYFHEDGFVFTLVDADLLISDPHDIHYRLEIVIDYYTELKARPKSPDILSDMMIEVNTLARNGKFVNEEWKPMTQNPFVLRSKVTRSVVAKGYALVSGDKEPLAWFERHVHPELELVIDYDRS